MMRRTPTKKRRAGITLVPQPREESRLQVTHELETETDWTPQHLRVHPRIVRVEASNPETDRSGAKISIGEDEQDDPSTVLLHAYMFRVDPRDGTCIETRVDVGGLYAFRDCLNRAIREAEAAGFLSRAPEGQ